MRELAKNLIMGFLGITNMLCLISMPLYAELHTGLGLACFVMVVSSLSLLIYLIHRT